MPFVYIGLVAVAFALIVFFLVFRKGRETLRDTGPQNRDSSDPNNSQWKQPANRD